MDIMRDQIYLAGLLHDIGKFYQRADANGAAKSIILSEKVKKLEITLCPVYKSVYSHKHVLWTAQLFENLEKHFKSSIRNTELLNVDDLLLLSASHHKPDENNLLHKIIQKADHYSSGADRSNLPEAWKDAAEEDDKNWDAFKRIRMLSVLEAVRFNAAKEPNISYTKKLPLTAVQLSKDFFPKDKDHQSDATDYKKLWADFETEVKFIQNTTLSGFNETLLFLLEKYTSRIPASTVHLPDVSLYDHLKTTAAFSLALYDYIQDNGLKEIPKDLEKPFALVGGALSGIQKFIYNIVAKGAAKNLKGRSFYLQLLVDNVVQKVLDELGLPGGHIIYASGGGFYLITASTAELHKKLDNLEKELAERMFAYHGTELYLSLAAVPFGEKELFAQTESETNISTVWKALADKLSAKKARRFQYLLTENFDALFSPKPFTVATTLDVITGEEITGTVEYLDDDRQQPVSSYTWQQIELGKQLKHTDYWILSKEKLSYLPSDIFCFEPIGSGLYNYFIAKEDLEKYENKLRQSADNVRVLFFNKGNFLEPLHKGTNNIYGFYWYGGNNFPENNFKEPLPKNFEELAGAVFQEPSKKSETPKRMYAPGLVRLGVLRMDVDNLGTIFKSGLHPAKRSFSRYSTLSRSLDYFFKGYLNNIWGDERFKQHTQIIYAGGDDLFIVGKWDILIQMAAQIRQDFKEWTCGNPQLTLSGGMAIVGARFPILKSAGFSEVLEKAAKGHTYGDRSKNAFAFLSYVPNKRAGEEEITVALNWDNEIPYLNDLKQEIKNLTKEDLSENFATDMYHLMQQADFQWDDKEKLFQPKNYRVVWLAAYNFKRAEKGKSEKLQTFFKDWVYNIMTGKVLVKGENILPRTRYHALQFLALAARWAALERRSELLT